LRSNLGPDFECTGGGTSPGAGGSQKVINFLAVFKTVDSLVGQINFDSLVGGGLTIPHSKDVVLGKWWRRNGDKLIVKNGSGGVGPVIIFDGLGIYFVLKGKKVGGNFEDKKAETGEKK